MLKSEEVSWKKHAYYGLAFKRATNFTRKSNKRKRTENKSRLKSENKLHFYLKCGKITMYSGIEYVNEEYSEVCKSENGGSFRMNEKAAFELSLSVWFDVNVRHANESVYDAIKTKCE